MSSGALQAEGGRNSSGKEARSQPWTDGPKTETESETVPESVSVSVSAVVNVTFGEPGWSTVPSLEIVNVADGVLHRAGDDWFIDRTTTVLPLCNYINAAGNYSLRSYSLSPEDKVERVMICRGGAAVAPYAGPCPPK